MTPQEALNYLEEHIDWVFMQGGDERSLAEIDIMDECRYAYKFIEGYCPNFSELPEEEQLKYLDAYCSATNQITDIDEYPSFEEVFEKGIQ